VFKSQTASNRKRETAWINGALTPLDKAVVPITDLGFQYGYGFFETIRAIDGKPKNLAAHMKRFETTWRHFFSDPSPDLSWEKIIGRVLFENGLENTTAVVKLMATRGTRNFPPYNHALIVTARPYVHRLTGKKEQGLTLALYPYPRQTPLAGHKTMNYLFYFLAGKWAAEQGTDEALITNPDGTISETNTANLVMIKDMAVVLPESPHVLPGTMESSVCNLLLSWGYHLERRRIFPGDLFSFDEVLMTNALMGAVPVLGIDGRRFKPPSDLWKKINQKLLATL